MSKRYKIALEEQFWIKTIKDNLCAIRTLFQQTKSASDEAIYQKKWWGLIRQALTDYKKSMKEELRDMLAT